MWLLSDKQTTQSFPQIADNDVSKREEGDGRRVQEGTETVGETLRKGEQLFELFWFIY